MGMMDRIEMVINLVVAMPSEIPATLQPHHDILPYFTDSLTLEGDCMELPIDYDKVDWRVRKLAREEYVKLQNGDCWYCKQPLEGKPPINVLSKRVNEKLFPPNFFKWPVHLHHCHNTGKTIGAVHNYCNAVLWQYHGQ